MPHAVGERLPLTYVLPLRRDELDDVSELAGYVRWLAPLVELFVVDGSPPEVFESHRDAFGAGLAHIPPDPRYSFANGKVDGVMTALDEASHERFVMADDDVRWDEASLRRVTELLAAADLVRPQNYFDPLPWHARWDTSRTLLNRAFGADYPGTLGVRRSLLLEVGGYDGDAMFENLELMRTIRAAGGTVVSPVDLYVRRLPPSTRQFVTQRVRQAYDDFAQPWRLVPSLAVLPATAASLARRRAAPVVVGAAVTVALAEKGRRPAGGTAVFPASCSLFTPLWVAERAVCSWLAVYSRVRWGGVRYRGRVLPLAATPMRTVRRRVAAARADHRSPSPARLPSPPALPNSVRSTPLKAARLHKVRS
ncbi:MAG TPA: glycosyltransferase [Acidimicrobiales bacterium]|nr:glycosyltransferase [Acidimicrobiales bacterium]